MTPQELSDTIGAIYDCALEPERWPVALKQVGDLCGAPFTFVVSHDLEKNLPGRTFRHGGQDEWMDLYCGKYAKYNPIPTSTWLRPIGEVYSVATLFSDEEWLETRFYKEFMEPGGLLDIGGLMALRSGKRAVWMGSMRTKDQDRFSPMDMQKFQLLSPHICVP